MFLELLQTTLLRYYEFIFIQWHSASMLISNKAQKQRICVVPLKGMTFLLSQRNNLKLI